jgi:2-keto-4-pentenoate hydratase/2-oxohepta-3-ene-1,7-dioic acid hydratase in catechol pathway
MTLEPGDMVATGTPAGTAFGRTPSARLRPDVVPAQLEGVGEAPETPIDARVEVGREAS